ncbi:MAG: hypothetical protein QOE28_537 [Solirubrobacteraceae bacterium]|nr:hypothetical protein [Solirubrobacteraceae bacterium]
MVRSRLDALILAAAALAGLLWLWVASEYIGGIARSDLATYYQYSSLLRWVPYAGAQHLIALVDPGRFAVLAALVVAVPLVSRRWKLAAVTVGAILAANLVTQILKALTLSSRAIGHIGIGGWPSGHQTAAAALGLCALLVVPRRARPLAASAVALWMTAMGCALVVVGSHRPSDVMAGMLVGGLCAALAAAIARATAHGGGRGEALRAGRAVGIAGAACGLAGAAALVVSGRGGAALRFAADHGQVVGWTALIAVLAAALAIAGCAVSDR